MITMATHNAWHKQHPIQTAMLWTLLVLSLFTLVWTGRASASDARPNVVLIVADDLGYGDVGFNGGTLIATPNIDRIAREGARFTQFFSSANVCTPSRAGILTGRYPVRSGLAGGVLYPFSDYGIGSQEILLPELLQDAGYTTWLVGKWHLGAIPEARPRGHGFDYFFGLLFSNDMPGVALLRDGAVVEEPLDQAALHGRLAAEAVRLIDGAGSEPFFLYFAPVAPHTPIVPGPEHAGNSPAGPYGDVVEELDAGVGRILDALKRNKLAENTLVLFTSDNGRAFEGSSGGARGMKAGTGEGAYAVPLAVRWPAEIAAGTHSDAISMNIDLLPTVLDFAGIPLPEELALDGASLAGQVRGESSPAHDVLYFFDGAQIAAVRDQRWRYVVRTYYSKFQVDHLSENFHYPLLFDLQSHGSELYNLGPRFPQVAERLHGRLLVGREEFESLPQMTTPLPEPD